MCQCHVLQFNLTHCLQELNDAWMKPVGMRACICQQVNVLWKLLLHHRTWWMKKITNVCELLQLGFHEDETLTCTCLTLKQ